MKTPIPIGLIALFLFCTGCSKTVDSIIEKTTFPKVPDATGFTHFTIKAGTHYASGNTFMPIETGELKFAVKFDSTAVYQCKASENQNDINKLYGFSDNSAPHHEFSARIGWRWSGGALRLFGYVYNNSVRIEKELSIIPIGSPIKCAIKVSAGYYDFTVGERTDRLPRASTTTTAKGYQLYPYFGGDEAAPHDVNIWIKPL